MASAKEIKTEQNIKESENWCRLALCTNIHLKQAFLNVLHNKINNVTINALPSDPTDLYNFMVRNKNTLDTSLRRNILKKDQHENLLHHNSSITVVDSSALDITLIRFLIRTFCNITNMNGNWNEPKNTDRSIVAAVWRGTQIRNQICHHNDITSLNDIEFENIWIQIENVLLELSYTGDISLLKTQSLDSNGIREAKKQLHSTMAEDFDEILSTYKDECKKSPMQNFIGRVFRQKSSNQTIPINVDTLLLNNEAILISGEAGLGKTYSAKDLRYKWSMGEILDGKKMLYIDSKRVVKEMYKPSFAAPICVSELRGILNNQTDAYLASFGCVRKSVDDLIVVIDGVDELPIGNLDMPYLNKLKIKIDKNDDISGMETIVGIYFGFFFPGSKIIVFGRKHEMDRLIDVQNQVHKSNLFDKSKRTELELQPLCENDIKELINRISCNSTNCECVDCSHIYKKVQDVEFRNVPSHLVAFVKIYKSLPDKNIGRMTKSKLFICTLFNLLKNHTQTVVRDPKTFKRLLGEISQKFAESIRKIARMSFLSLLDNNVTIDVEEVYENNVVYLKFEQTIHGVHHCIKIEREIMEQIDLFYIRDVNYFFTLEPYHLTNMEYLAACYIFCHNDEWDLLLRLSKDRLFVILPYLAGLFADDYFTRDFSSHILNIYSYSIEHYFDWLYDIKDIRNILPNGGVGFKCWYGLTYGSLTPSFYLLDAIDREIEIPENFIPKNIVCYCNSSSFEWHSMTHFKHDIITKHNNSNKFNNINSFLDKFNDFKIIVKGDIDITDNNHIDLINTFYNHNNITFRINNLDIDTKLTANMKHNIKSNALNIFTDDSHTRDIILSALSPHTRTHTAAPPAHATTHTTINVKHLDIYRARRFNSLQTENLFEVGLSAVDVIALRTTFFTTKQIKTLHTTESKHKHKHKQITFQLYYLDFKYMLALPSLGTRHVALYSTSNANDVNLNKLKAKINKSHKHLNISHLNNYKIIQSSVPFIRKDIPMTNSAFYLHLYQVNFKNVSSNVFASTFSFIPTLECKDMVDDIPSSHWNELSRTNETQMNELRIWGPTLKNLDYFIRIKTNTLQLICESKDELKKILDHISNSSDETNKTMKVFVVKCDVNDWDYYDEIELFSENTIEEFKNNQAANILQLDEISATVPFYEGEQHLRNWCCDIRVIKDITVSESDEESVISDINEEIEDSPRKQTSWQKFKGLFKRK